jgi:Ulp1 family protease
MIQPSFFWTGCDQTYERKLTSLSGIIGNVFVKDFTEIQSSLSVIYFPFCHGHHWYVGVIDLKGRKIRIVDSLNRPPPRTFVRALLYVLGIVGVDTSEWNPRCGRSKCPTQQDSHSCGVAALSFIQSRGAESDTTADQWSPEYSDIYRLR